MKIRVWDLPTRLFHWMLAVAVVALVATAQVGGEAMVWHFRLGYLVLALLLFRGAWGLVGGHWSRFASFVRGPAAVWRYLRGRGEPLQAVGHTPLGSLSVLAMLLALAAQVGSGLFADDEIATTGPFAAQVSTALSLRLTWYHTVIGEPLVIGLVLLHLAAIGYYAGVRRQNLVGPMCSGDKEVDMAAPASRDSAATRAGALVVFAVALAAVAALLQMAG